MARQPWAALERHARGTDRACPGGSQGVSSMASGCPHLCRMEFYQVLCGRWAFTMSEMNNDKENIINSW